MKITDNSCFLDVPYWHCTDCCDEHGHKPMGTDGFIVVAWSEPERMVWKWLCRECLRVYASYTTTMEV